MSSSPHTFVRRAAGPLIVAFATLALYAANTHANLTSRYSAHQRRAGALQSAIAGESSRIAGYQGTIRDLRARLATIDRSLRVQEAQLSGARTDLTAARTRLGLLEHDLTRDRRTLAHEVVAAYESPPPSLVGVLVNSHGFEELLTGLSSLKRIESRNLAAIKRVGQVRTAVADQITRLAAIERRRARAFAAVAVERDQVADLKLSIVDREIGVSRERSRNRQTLTKLRGQLSREAAKLTRLAIAAATAAATDTGSGGAPVNACVNTAFVPHGGPYGFFPAAGTNYSVGEEPVIAARLDVLGRALQLRLIGVSGYRSPRHSVEVGGFADDPHTHGEASDTPGVEGVSEPTLERFCLTRPFPGPREADHVQER